ncbi:DUF4338 domain-containing protein [Paenibacillus peoriae]|uniref:Druantia anti-phage system protein DruA n=1 Tax=Paenibacillus peoriae TaxID=59893 RepID=UPI00026C5C88|nr:Druantia anti-phage system protein DruA [Paenibacillus peoriae]MEC0183041.1 DUF4338 domain-containing protein [Paenibacillus peoriae]
MIAGKSVIQPSLSKEYLQNLTEILKTAEGIMAGQERALWIANNIPDPNNDEVLDEMRFRSLLLLFRDLFSQGWELTFRDGIANIYHPITPDNVETKQWYREALLRERNKQLENDSIKKFIFRMEKERKYNGKKVSIRNLISPVDELLSGIQEWKADAIKPYLQIVQSRSDRDEKTGFKLLDIWRYFRLTWTLPHKPTPGRNIFVLVRDSAQEYHPIIGIAALGNSIVQITCRDNEIGWTLEGLRERMNTMDDITARQIINSLTQSLVKSISGIEVRDLLDEEVDLSNAEEYANTLSVFLRGVGNRAAAPRITSNSEDVNWNDICQSPFYKVKRAKALLNIFKAQTFFNNFNVNEPLKALQQLVMTSRGRSALSTALQSNKKEKVGANMMDIIVCGAVPPYNFLLGGKLTSMLMLSPELIQAYQKKYKNQISVIASAMKGEPVVKPAHLVFLGTTSLYETGSSQYNRVTIPEYALNGSEPMYKIGFESLGITKGFGTVYISDETVEAFSELTTKLYGRRIVNNTFGEGTSPRMRLIRAGLDALGLPSDHLLNHNFKRIVYGVRLADNAYEYLRGEEDEPRYYLSQDEPHQMTEAICEFWRKRWLSMRIKNNDVMQQLINFGVDDFLLGKKIGQ